MLGWEHRNQAAEPQLGGEEGGGGGRGGGGRGGGRRQGKLDISKQHHPRVQCKTWAQQDW